MSPLDRGLVRWGPSAGRFLAWLIAVAMNLTAWVIPFGWPDFGRFIYTQVFPPFIGHLDVLRQAPWADGAHRFLGGMLFLAGALQFEPSLRRRWPHVHRLVGRSYALLGTWVVASAIWLGIKLPFAAFPETAITTAAALSYGLLLTLAVRAALQRQLIAHREWIIRAHALVSFVATMRVLTGVFFHAGAPATGQEMFLTSGVFAIAINLTLAEWWIHTSRSLQPTPPPHAR